MLQSAQQKFCSDINPNDRFGLNDEMLTFDDFFVQVFGKTNMRVLTFFSALPH